MSLPLSRRAPSCLQACCLLHGRPQVCRRKGCDGPSPSDRFSWPSIVQGCNTVVVSQAAEQPLSYLLPLLTHLLLNSVHAPHTSSTGVSAVCINLPLLLLFLFLHHLLMCWCAATCSAAVPRLGEGAVGVRATGGHQDGCDPSPRHCAAGRWQGRSQDL